MNKNDLMDLEDALLDKLKGRLRLLQEPEEREGVGDVLVEEVED